MDFKDRDDLVDEIILSNIETGILDVDNLVEAIDRDKKVLNLLHLNIRSIRQNFNNLLTFLETYKCNYCDFIVLGECFRLDDGVGFNIPGYTGHYNSANFNKNDGLYVFVRSEISTSVNDFKFELSGVTFLLD